MKRFRVGIVGATGMVGQQFISRLENHPWLTLTSLSASARSAGKPYKDAVAGRWKLAKACPDYVSELPVHDGVADINSIARSVDIVFSATNLNKDATRQLEEAYADKGVAVISNNSAHRWSEDVPMLIPEINHGHSRLIDIQRRHRGWTTGLIAVKPNCSIQSYVIVLSALKAFGPLVVNVTSLQAVSGAGRSLNDWPEMVDNVIPFIAGEETKSQQEPLKIWGKLGGDKIALAESPSIIASCFRVPISDGPLADVCVGFTKKPSHAEVLAAIEAFAAPLKALGLPSSPQRLIHYTAEPDRPQTKLDRDCEQGMSVSLGRMRELPIDSPYDWRFISLAHNTVRGAAGGAILIAELLVKQGYIKQRGNL